MLETGANVQFFAHKPNVVCGARPYHQYFRTRKKKEMSGWAENGVSQTKNEVPLRSNLHIFVDLLAGVSVALFNAVEAYRLAETYIDARRKLGQHHRGYKLLFRSTACRGHKGDNDGQVGECAGSGCLLLSGNIYILYF